MSFLRLNPPSACAPIKGTWPLYQRSVGREQELLSAVQKFVALHGGASIVDRRRRIVKASHLERSKHEWSLPTARDAAVVNPHHGLLGLCRSVVCIRVGGVGRLHASGRRFHTALGSGLLRFGMCRAGQSSLVIFDPHQGNSLAIQSILLLESTLHQLTLQDWLQHRVDVLDSAEDCIRVVENTTKSLLQRLQLVVCRGFVPFPPSV
mmetsp:Transcript_73371/g.101943  ORF Transcript_73371/g.101943 Transcript_73371/m.101943 type:complete len:207 (-) Transcript_73371:388-1008(-)